MSQSVEGRLPLGEHDVFVLIADISGYTEFIKFTELEMHHAQVTLSALLGAMWDAGWDAGRHDAGVGALEPLKTEGDAILFAGADDPARVAAALEAVLKAYYQTRTALDIHGGCTCAACSSLPSLELKVVGHYGRALLHEFKGARDIAGLTVVTAHRLLKNSITGSRYVALSASAAGLPIELGARAKILETYPDVGALELDVQRFDPTPWRAETPQALSAALPALQRMMGG